MIKNKLKIKLSGLNQNHFLQECLKHKIPIKNYIQKTRSQASFVVSSANYKKMDSLGLFARYSVCVKPISGINFWLLKLPQKIGFFAGIFACFLFVLFSNQKILKISIVAPNAQTKSEISKFLNSNNIVVGIDWKKINLETVEAKLFYSIKNLSNVSVQKNGTCLSITSGSSAASIARTSPIVAPEDCVIETLEIAKGTTKYKVGDIVQKGQAIVSASSTQKIIANVKIRVYRQSSVAISQFLYSLERTGNTQKKTTIIWPFLKQNPSFSCSYQQYEKEIITTNCFNNFLLPIKKITTIYHELKTIKINENQAIEKAKQKAKNLIEKELVQIDKISFKEREQNGQKFVDCFAEAVLEL